MRSWGEACLGDERERAQLAPGGLANDVQAVGVAAAAADVAHHPRDARVAVLQHVLQVALRMLHKVQGWAQGLAPQIAGTVLQGQELRVRRGSTCIRIIVIQQQRCILVRMFAPWPTFQNLRHHGLACNLQAATVMTRVPEGSCGSPGSTR